jgi:hypothetical protein
VNAVLFDRDLARLLGMGTSQFYKRKKAGEFRRFECSPQLPHSDTRYSVALVQRWLDGEPLDAPSSRVCFPKAKPGRPRLVG